jgi:hypothetical protein
LRCQKNIWTFSYKTRESSFWKYWQIKKHFNLREHVFWIQNLFKKTEIDIVCMIWNKIKQFDEYPCRFFVVGKISTNISDQTWHKIFFEVKKIYTFAGNNTVPTICSTCSCAK